MLIYCSENHIHVKCHCAIHVKSHCAIAAPMQVRACSLPGGAPTVP